MTYRGVFPDTSDLIESLGLGAVVVLNGEGTSGNVHHGPNNVQDGVLKKQINNFYCLYIKTDEQIIVKPLIS
jgi:hypothetical protein